MKIVFLRATAASNRSFASVPKLSPNNNGGAPPKSASVKSGLSRGFNCISRALLRDTDVWWFAFPVSCKEAWIADIASAGNSNSSALPNVRTRGITAPSQNCCNQLAAVPTGTYLCPPPNKSSASNKMLTRKHGSNHHRGDRTDKQSGNYRDTSCLTEFVSQIFQAEKKDGGHRPVVNLKCLNQYVKTEHFRMEGLYLLPDLLQAQDWMVRLDLKDAYLQVPIHLNHQHLLTFQWEGKNYMFKCLPFGLSSAPRVFTKLLKPVVGFLRQIGCRLIIYLDDMLILHQNREQLANYTRSPS